MMFSLEETMAADLPPTDATPPHFAPPPTPLPATPARGAAYRRWARGGMLTALVIAEGILLFLSTGTIFVSQQTYSAPYSGYQTAVDWQALALLLGLAALASFILPVVIGLLAPSWRAAAALPILAAWLALALLFLAALLFKPYAAARYLPAFYPSSSSFLGAYWLSYTLPAAALVAFLLFGALGWVGWAVRSAPAVRD